MSSEDNARGNDDVADSKTPSSWPSFACRPNIAFVKASREAPRDSSKRLRVELDSV